MKNIFGLSALMLLVGACSGQKDAPSKRAVANLGPEARDMRMICDEAKQAAAEEASTDERRNHFAAAVESKLSSDGVRKVWRSASTFADSEKHSAFKKGGHELGITGWECPAFATLYGPQVKAADSP